MTFAPSNAACLIGRPIQSLTSLINDHPPSTGRIDDLHEVSFVFDLFHTLLGPLGRCLKIFVVPLNTYHIRNTVKCYSFLPIMSSCKVRYLLDILFRTHNAHGDHPLRKKLFVNVYPLSMRWREDRQSPTDFPHLGIPNAVEAGSERLALIAFGGNENLPHIFVHSFPSSSFSCSNQNRTAARVLTFSTFKSPNSG
jgi:hypothetical protein